MKKIMTNIAVSAFKTINLIVRTGSMVEKEKTKGIVCMAPPINIMSFREGNLSGFSMFGNFICESYCKDILRGGNKAIR